MGSTASLTAHRILVGYQPPVYAALYSEARRLGVRMPELLRHIALNWVEERQRRSPADNPPIFPKGT